MDALNASNANVDNPSTIGSNNANTQSSDKQSTTASSVSLRVKTDPAWEHFAFKKEGKANVYTCLHCSSVYKGGGINRMKQHLAGIPGQISSCKKVPHDVRHKMIEFLKQVQQRKQTEDLNESYGDEIEGEPGVEEVQPPSSKRQLLTLEKRKKNAGVNNYFAPRTTPGSQPSLKSVLSSKEAQHRAKLTIVRWLYDSCIPFNALNSPYFQPTIDAIAAMGPGFRGPSFHEARVNLLQDCKKECQLLVESHRAKWSKTGCTLMADGWTDQRQRTLINFLVYSLAGIVFVKSIDASDVVKDAKSLFKMFFEVIEWVGPTNVVHVVTDNATNYVAAGKLIHEKYEHIYWSPCAAHCLNLLLKDIGSLPNVTNLTAKASKVTIFVYNHMIFLSWLRKRDGWKEIVRPGITRFATNFITLRSLYEHKHDLQALVIDKHFTSHKLAKTTAGKAISAIILDNKFWSDCYFYVRLVAPIIKLLRIVDADEKPSLGYVYEGMQRAKNAIKEMFRNRKQLYKPYTDIIKARWDRHLKLNLHAAAYFLNPAFFYDEKICEKNKVIQSVLDLFDIKSFCGNITKAIEEVQMYRDREASFGRDQAYSTAKTIKPYMWWTYYGGSAPTLKNIATRILGQTSSSSGCERNWSFFERIHTKKRNRLEHQRLSDLVYVNYNLRLKNRSQHKKKSYDPIDYESIDNVEFWIVEEEAASEFDSVDLENENFIYDDNAIPIIGESSREQGVEEVDIADQPILESLDDFGVGHDDEDRGDCLILDDNELASDGFNLNEYYDN